MPEHPIDAIYRLDHRFVLIGSLSSLRCKIGKSALHGSTPALRPQYVAAITTVNGGTDFAWQIVLRPASFACYLFPICFKRRKRENQSGDGSLLLTGRPAALRTLWLSASGWSRGISIEFGHLGFYQEAPQPFVDRVGTDLLSAVVATEKAKPKTVPASAYKDLELVKVNEGTWKVFDPKIMTDVPAKIGFWAGVGLPGL